MQLCSAKQDPRSRLSIRPHCTRARRRSFLMAYDDIADEDVAQLFSEGVVDDSDVDDTYSSESAAESAEEE